MQRLLGSVICFFSISLMSPPLFFAQGLFSDEIIIIHPANGPVSVYTTDLDNDGDLDVLSASWFDDKIAWFENIDGQGSFGPQQVITTFADGAQSVYAADIDGDGDMDVLSASHDDIRINDNKIAWYENTDGLGNFGSQQVITTAASGAQSVYAADIDGDGDMDVLSASADDDKIAWYENTDGKGTFGAQQVITTSADGARSVYAADLDGDGDMDVLSASSFDNMIAWYMNTDGQGSFGPQQVITTLAGGAVSVYAADLDNDGDMDVLSASAGDQEIAWYENIDGLGSFGPQQIIMFVDVPRSVHAADLDGDGDMDVLSASADDDKVAWYENTDGKGTFGAQQVITTSADGARSVYAADLDGDGDMDVLSASFSDDTVEWFENTDGRGSFGPQSFIATSADDARSVYAADLDGDGDLDALSASADDDKIAWYENTDGKGNFGAQQIITTSADAAWSVYAADLDSDGDMDVLSASAADKKIAWYENTDGQGNFGSQQVITTAASGALSVYAADMDGDGDMDVLSASWLDNKVSWYENTDGKGNFGPQQVVSTAMSEAWSVYAADLDSDGDMDMLSASRRDDKIAWYENTDGKGNFGTQQVITTSADEAFSVYAADLDGDGDMDVLSASWLDNKISWYENTNAQGNFGPQQVVSTVARGLGASSVYAADVDGDGDMDILSAHDNLRINENKIAWYENTDGKGSFGPQQGITTAGSGAQSVYAADLDSDGDMDILSASSEDDKIAWYRNLSENPTTVSTEIQVLHEFDLRQNYPNPFNPETHIIYKLSKAAEVKLEIYNIKGQGVATLVDQKQPQGDYSVTWQGKDDSGRPVPSGIYVYRLQTGSFVESKKMVLLR